MIPPRRGTSKARDAALTTPLSCLTIVLLLASVWFPALAAMAGGTGICTSCENAGSYRKWGAGGPVCTRYIGPFALKRKLGVGAEGTAWLAMTRRTGHGCVERGYPERLGTKFKSIRAKMREQRKTFDPVVPPIVVLKEGKNPISRTLLREIYFGLLLSTKRAQFHPGPKRHVCPFQGHLHTRKRGIKKLWLVFSYHGKSLEKTLYKEQEPWLRSIEWDEYRVSLDGQETMRSIMEQLLYALGSLHEVGITHRDLKPGNDLWDGSTILLIDFGSAIDTFSMKFLYGRSGPGRAQQSPIYSAPESFLYSNWKGYFRPNSADMWSLGVLMMELIGVEETFERPSTTLDALLRQYFQLLQPVEWSIVAKLLYYTEMCILKQTVWPFCVGRRWPPSILNL